MLLPNFVYDNTVFKQQLTITANYVRILPCEQALWSGKSEKRGARTSMQGLFVRTTSYHVCKMFLHTGLAIRTLIN